MKYIIYLAIIFLALIFPWVDKLLPKTENSGVIESMSEPTQSPIPHRKANIVNDGREVESIIYESNVKYKVGDNVLIQKDAQFEQLYTVTDINRTPSITRLFILFLIVILTVSGVAGLRSLLGLVFSFVIIFNFVLPQIVAGINPLTVALTASVIILIVTYFLTHGINNKSVIAILGTLGALTITGILALTYGALTKLSGFGTEETSFLVGNMPISSIYNLYLAGIIIGSLGVLDDITISQASIVYELSKANHKFNIRDLYIRAMRVGHDHISSLVNTLVLVYTGSALPLLLLFITSQSSPVELINYEPVAEEIVRTLVGSIGLVTAVPLTTLIAAYWYGSKK